MCLFEDNILFDLGPYKLVILQRIKPEFVSVFKSNGYQTEAI